MTGNQPLDSLSSSLPDLMMTVMTVALFLIAIFQLLRAYEALKRLADLRAKIRVSVDKQELLHRCIDTKGQRVVSIERLAKELGVEVPSNEEIERIVEGRK